MNDLPRDKYEILDLIFTFLIALCMVFTAIFLLNNLIVSLIYVIVVVLFAFVAIILWNSRNPFNIYLVRAFAFNNFIVTFITLIIFFTNFSPTSTDLPGYILLLIPSVIYLIISLKFSAFSSILSRRAGVMLAYAGKTRAARRIFFGDNPEEIIKRKQLLTEQKEKYRYKIIIVLVTALTLSSFAALIFGF